IDNDPASTLFVAEIESAVVGCIQLTIIPGLSFSGMRRAIIEDVRVDKRCRGNGIGHRLMENAILTAQTKGCRMVQLFVHEARSEAHRFYADFGFGRQHLGMRLRIEPAD
ncbi:MAG: GNAT family N-acetyltransferase, partial [Proteobacteria bacterium]|nr:GNAT family N-acetyltransferase [Pseudomonadota bacterium]